MKQLTAYGTSLDNAYQSTVSARLQKVEVLFNHAAEQYLDFELLSLIDYSNVIVRPNAKMRGNIYNSQSDHYVAQHIGVEKSYLISLYYICS